MKWLKRLFGGKSPVAGGVAERVQALESELEALKVTLAEREKTVANLKRELEHQRSGEEARLEAAVNGMMERLLRSAAASAAQLVRFAWMQEQGLVAPSRDVLGVARRLVATLEEAGLRLEGTVGEQVAYNPGRHEPLNTAANPMPGQSVVVRLAGVSYRGKLLRRAGVELPESPVECKGERKMKMAWREIES